MLKGHESAAIVVKQDTIDVAVKQLKFSSLLYHATRESCTLNYYYDLPDILIAQSITSYQSLTNSRYSLFKLSWGIKGVNCVECKLLHCEYKASRGVDY